MDEKTESKKKLVLPAALAVVVLASGCGGGPSPSNDAGPSNDTAVADADFDAGCVPPDVYDPTTRTCVPIV